MIYTILHRLAIGVGIGVVVVAAAFLVFWLVTEAAVRAAMRGHD